MNRSTKAASLSALLPLLLAAVSAPLAAQEAAGEMEATVAAPAQVVSPEAMAVLNRMTRSLQGLQQFSINAQSTRDEVVALGYKLQNIEQSTMTVRRPDGLRVELSGDIRDRTFVYDGSHLTMYSPDDAAYTSIEAPGSVGQLITSLLDAGVDMPLIDVLTMAFTGNLVDEAMGGVLVGPSTIDGVACDHLAIRQPDIDWQLWVEQGPRSLPRKIVITTRYEVGQPQYQATLDWDLRPRIHASTFIFTPPKDALEIPFDGALIGDDTAR